MEHRQKPASADLPAHIAIHPRTLTHIASHESLDRIPPWRNGRNATSRPGDLAGIYAGMGLLGSGKFLRGGTPVVKYVAIDLIWLHIVVEYHPLIDSPADSSWRSGDRKDALGCRDTSRNASPVARNKS